MSSQVKRNVIEPTNVADVPRLMFLASICRLWQREYTTLRMRTRRRNEHVAKRKLADRKLSPRQPRWDWTSAGAPVMR